MKIRRQVLAALLTTFLASATSATAQVENNIDVSAVGNGTYIQITVSMDIGGTLPESWVGWVVDRRTLGICEPEFRLGPVTPFPTGAQEYVLNDTSAIETITYKYRVYAVDDHGERHYLGSPPTFPPAYYHDDYASLGVGIVAGGTIVDLGWALGVELCPDDCWEPISFISFAPQGLEELAGNLQPIWLRGFIDNEFEGPYITQVLSWDQPRWGCSSPLDDQETSWGTLKSRYR